MRRLLVLVLVATVLAACGSDRAASDTVAGKKYVDALMVSYRTGQAKNAFTPSQAQCLSERVVDAAGTAGLKDVGLKPSDLDHGSSFKTIGSKLSKADAKKVATAIVDGDCVNPGDALLKAGVGRNRAFVKFPKPAVTCLFRTLGRPQAARRAFADSLLGLPQGDAEFTKSFQDQKTFRRTAATCKVDPALLK